MRHLLAFVLMIALVGSAAAFDLGSVEKDLKTNDHVGMNPGTPDGREGGETMADAFAIGGLPFNDSGNTNDNVNDYDAICPYSGSTAPDVVYSYTPAGDEIISVDLCGSTYDTKVYVMDGDLNLIACNDDAYFGDPCGTYVSFIGAAELMGGTEYFIIVDGYGTDSGDYLLEVLTAELPSYCDLPCDGVEEGEPSIVGAYVDNFNGGCNSDPSIFGDFLEAADGDGNMLLCGNAGWSDTGRDTDWIMVTIGITGMVTWTVDAQSTTNIYLLGGDVANCGDITVDDNLTVGPCGAPGTMVLQGNPGDVLFLWIGSDQFSNPDGNLANEYMWASSFEGLYPGIIATENVSFDGIKSLYR